MTNIFRVLLDSLHKYWILIQPFLFCLQIHERSHTGEKGWICDECGDVFGGKQALDFHKSKHSGQYNFICSHCDRGFNSKTILYEHSLTHSGKDLFRSGRNTLPILNLWNILRESEAGGVQCFSKSFMSRFIWISRGQIFFWVLLKLSFKLLEPCFLEIKTFILLRTILSSLYFQEMDYVLNFNRFRKVFLYKFARIYLAFGMIGGFQSSL